MEISSLYKSQKKKLKNGSEKNHGGMFRERMRTLVVLELQQGGIQKYLEIHSRDLYIYIVKLIKTRSAKQKNQIQQQQNGLTSNLHPRDIRKMDRTFSSANESAIIVRRHVILMNIDPIRAIVLHDRILALVPEGADQIISNLRKNILDSEVINNSTSFEFRAVEAILSLSVSILTYSYVDLQPQIHELLQNLTNTNSYPSIKEQEKLRRSKDEISSLDSRIQSLCLAIEQVLDDSNDLALMNLERQQKIYDGDKEMEIKEVDAEEAELLLEAYLQEAKALRRTVEAIQQRMRTTEALVQLKLNIARNRFLLVNSIFALVSMCIGFGGVIASIFGMNLQSGKFTAPHWFAGVFVSTVGFMLCIGLGTFTYYSKIGVLS